MRNLIITIELLAFAAGGMIAASMIGGAVSLAIINALNGG